MGLINIPLTAAFECAGTEYRTIVALLLNVIKIKLLCYASALSLLMSLAKLLLEDWPTGCKIGEICNLPLEYAYHSG